MYSDRLHIHVYYYRVYSNNNLKIYYILLTVANNDPEELIYK